MADDETSKQPAEAGSAVRNVVNAFEEQPHLSRQQRRADLPEVQQDPDSPTGSDEIDELDLKLEALITAYPVAERRAVVAELFYDNEEPWTRYRNAHMRAL